MEYVRGLQIICWMLIIVFYLALYVGLYSYRVKNIRIYKDATIDFTLKLGFILLAPVISLLYVVFIKELVMGLSPFKRFLTLFLAMYVGFRFIYKKLPTLHGEVVLISIRDQENKKIPMQDKMDLLFEDITSMSRRFA